MTNFYLSLIVGTGLFVSTWIHPALVGSATVLLAGDSSKVVTLRNTTVKDGAVSGDLVNKSNRTIRDVQLLIRNIWHWKNEFRPGDDSPGDAVYYTVQREIPPGGSVPFTYNPQTPSTPGPNGNFETTVSVAGFTEVIR